MKGKQLRTAAEADENPEIEAVSVRITRRKPENIVTEEDKEKVEN